MEDQNRCCASCMFYCNYSGDYVCDDYDGLYFKCIMRPDEHCPDYKPDYKSSKKSIAEACCAV